MWLGSAVRDFSPAYPPSCAVEELSLEAPLRSWGFAANSFPMRSLHRFFWEWQRYDLTGFLRSRESVSLQRRPYSIPRRGLVQPLLWVVIDTDVSGTARVGWSRGGHPVS